MRNGYKDSLGIASPARNEILLRVTSAVPEIFQVIYGNVAGTYRNAENQKYMDFVPGYRLIHIKELEREQHTLLQILAPDDIRKTNSNEEMAFLTMVLKVKALLVPNIILI